MKVYVYMLGVFTGLLVMMYGLKSMDTEIHNLARVSAGVILIVSHSFCLFLLYQKHLKNNSAEDTLNVTEMKAITEAQKELAASYKEIGEAQATVLSTKQMVCVHDFPYDFMDCKCTKCGINLSTFDPKIKKDS